MVYDFIVGKWNGDHVLLQGCYLQDWAMGLWFKLSKLGVQGMWFMADGVCGADTIWKCVLCLFHCVFALI